MFKNTVFGVGSILLLCSSILTSCGPKSIKPAGDGFQETPLSLDPIPVIKQQDVCHQSFAREVDVRLTINQFFNGESVESRYDFFNQLVGNNVQSPLKAPISEMLYGASVKLTQTRRYNPESGKFENDAFKSSDFIRYSKSKKLNVCPGTRKYRAYTFEEVGLNISNTITKAHSALKSIGVELEPISVSVAPKILVVRRLVSRSGHKVKTTGYEVDNAYYSSEEKQITFLPQSKTYKDRSGSAPFWQMPFVSAHEYGHHVFASLFGNKIKNASKTSEHCFLDHKYEEANDHKKTILNDEEKRDNSSKFAISAINEGFSDLISLYVLGKEQGSAKNVPCFEKTREAGSPFNFYGARKIFNRSALRAMNSDKEIESSRRCHDLNFQQIHKVGAVFAYTFDSIFRSLKFTPEEKLKILVKWLGVLKNNHDKLKDELAGDYMFEALELALVEGLKMRASDGDILLSKMACITFKRAFPSRDTTYCSN